MTCFSLLFAAAVCFSLNSYKMTLDVTKRTPFLAFKAILVVQVGTIVYTRVILWFPTCARMLSHFADAGDTSYYRGGLGAAGLMTLFNLAILNDAVVTFVKWIPKPLPEPTTRGDLCGNQIYSAFASTRHLLDGVAMSVPHRVHPTHWLISTQAATRRNW